MGLCYFSKEVFLLTFHFDILQSSEYVYTGISKTQ